MNCLQAEENFSAHFEDALDYQTLQQFESHITDCEGCQQEYAQFRDSVMASQQLPQVEPSTSFLPTLQERLSHEQRESLSFWQRLQLIINMPKWVYAGVLILILSAGGTFFYHDDLFNSDIPSFDETEIITTTSSQSPIDNIDEFFPRGLGGIGSSRNNSTRPMQQHYILKQVSYTTASTAGGL